MLFAGKLRGPTPFPEARAGGPELTKREPRLRLLHANSEAAHTLDQVVLAIGAEPTYRERRADIAYRPTGRGLKSLRGITLNQNTRAVHLLRMYKPTHKPFETRLISPRNELVASEPQPRTKRGVSGDTENPRQVNDLRSSQVSHPVAYTCFAGGQLQGPGAENPHDRTHHISEAF